MNELSPQMIYKRTQATAVPELNDVHDLIYVTLKELHRSLAVLNENPLSAPMLTITILREP